MPHFTGDSFELPVKRPKNDSTLSVLPTAQTMLKPSGWLQGRKNLMENDPNEIIQQEFMIASTFGIDATLRKFFGHSIRCAVIIFTVL